MASSVNGGEVSVRVLSRSLVKASDESIQLHVLPVSNLNLLPQTIQVSMFCIYPIPPPTANFHDVVAAFTAGLPSLLNYYFPTRRPNLHRPGLRNPRDPLLQPRRGTRRRRCGRRGAL
uniref:Uncharacterized protein n=1 Tax=Leersia perrieri TaxID=77586 RepID=A0A0D9UZB1_9ORYZ